MSNARASISMHHSLNKFLVISLGKILLSAIIEAKYFNILKVLITYHKMVYQKMCTILHSCQACIWMPILYSQWDWEFTYSFPSQNMYNESWYLFFTEVSFSLDSFIFAPLVPDFPHIKGFSLSFPHVHINITASCIHPLPLQNNGLMLETPGQSFVPTRPVLDLIFPLYSLCRPTVRAHHYKRNVWKFLQGLRKPMHKVTTPRHSRRPVFCMRP